MSFVTCCFSKLEVNGFFVVRSYALSKEANSIKNPYDNDITNHETTYSTSKRKGRTGKQATHFLLSTQSNLTMPKTSPRFALNFRNSQAGQQQLHMNQSQDVIALNDRNSRIQHPPTIKTCRMGGIQVVNLYCLHLKSAFIQLPPPSCPFSCLKGVQCPIFIPAKIQR